MRGLLIAMEGGEGAGKTTQSALLRDKLAACGHRAISVKEPGSTALGDHLREYLKSKRPINPAAETLLFQAARAQLAGELIAPALDAGIHVITDRFTGSTTAYQGYGKGVDTGDIEWLNRFATGGLEPDLTVLLDTEPGGRERRIAPVQRSFFTADSGAGRDDPAEERKFEDMPGDFHRRVRKGYLEQARRDPAWTVIPGDAPVEEVAAGVWQAVAAAMERRQAQDTNQRPGA